MNKNTLTLKLNLEEENWWPSKVDFTLFLHERLDEVNDAFDAFPLISLTHHLYFVYLDVTSQNEHPGQETFPTETSSDLPGAETFNRRRERDATNRWARTCPRIQGAGWWQNRREGGGLHAHQGQLWITCGFLVNLYNLPPLPTPHHWSSCSITRFNLH